VRLHLAAVKPTSLANTDKTETKDGSNLPLHMIGENVQKKSKQGAIPKTSDACLSHEIVRSLAKPDQISWPSEAFAVERRGVAPPDLPAGHMTNGRRC